MSIANLVRWIGSKIRNRFVVQVVKPIYVPVFQNELLKGRRALITGGTSGIGFEIAKRFIASGAEVIITGRSNGHINAALQELGSKKASGLVLDVLKIDSFEEKLRELKERNVMPDILVNNAGSVSSGGEFMAAEVEEYDLVMNTNLRGAAFLSHMFARFWIASNMCANILNVCSTSSKRPGVSPYIMSKWGLKSLTLGLAKMYTSRGIVVNGIAPGPTDTAIFLREKGENLVLSRNPSGRLATRVEVANLAVILVSDLSKMVVGDILYVGGGAAVITFDD